MVRGLRRFIEDEHAAVTIEFVAVFPLFVFLTFVFIDASILYLTRTEMFEISRDAARRISVGAISVDDVSGYVNDQLLLAGRTYTLASYSGSLVIIEMSVSVADASLFGIFTPVLGRTMGVRVVMLREPTPEVASSEGGITWWRVS